LYKDLNPGVLPNGDILARRVWFMYSTHWIHKSEILRLHPVDKDGLEFEFKEVIVKDAEDPRIMYIDGKLAMTYVKVNKEGSLWHCHLVFIDECGHPKTDPVRLGRLDVSSKTTHLISLPNGKYALIDRPNIQGTTAGLQAYIFDKLKTALHPPMQYWREHPRKESTILWATKEWPKIGLGTILPYKEGEDFIMAIVHQARVKDPKHKIYRSALVLLDPETLQPLGEPIPLHIPDKNTKGDVSGVIYETGAYLLEDGDTIRSYAGSSDAKIIRFEESREAMIEGFWKGQPVLTIYSDFNDTITDGSERIDEKVKKSLKTNQEREEFDKKLAKYKEIYEENPSPETLNDYWRVLSGYLTLKQCQEIAGDIVLNEKYISVIQDIQKITGKDIHIKIVSRGVEQIIELVAQRLENQQSGIKVTIEKANRLMFDKNNIFTGEFYSPYVDKKKHIPEAILYLSDTNDSQAGFKNFIDVNNPPEVAGKIKQWMESVGFEAAETEEVDSSPDSEEKGPNQPLRGKKLPVRKIFLWLWIITRKAGPGREAGQTPDIPRLLVEIQADETAVKIFARQGYGDFIRPNIQVSPCSDLGLISRLLSPLGRIRPDENGQPMGFLFHQPRGYCADQAPG
jgi:predicted GH43/DUF377 family glycosyl hydrolase